MTDNNKMKNGFHVTLSFVQPSVISGFIEADSEEEAIEKIKDDFAQAECVKILDTEPMDSETASKILAGQTHPVEDEEETPRTLQ